MKRIIFIFLSLFTFNSWAVVNFSNYKIPTYSEFVGGINIDHLENCTNKMQSMCQETLDKALSNKSNSDGDNAKKFQDYATCMRQQMQTENVCSQSLALLEMLKPDFVEILNVQHYPLFDAVEAEINKDDKQKWYFIVDTYGEFIDTRVVYGDMKNSTVYPYLEHRHHNIISATQDSFPPRYETLPLGEMRLVFSRSLLDGCETCAKIGYMESGYDFKKDGTFKWVKMLRIVPNEKVPVR